LSIDQDTIIISVHLIMQHKHKAVKSSSAEKPRDTANHLEISWLQIEHLRLWS